MFPRRLLLLTLASACQGLRLLEEAENPADNASSAFGTGDPELEDLVDYGEVTEQEEEEYRRASGERVQLRDTPFRNVLLVVHCRLKGARIHSTEDNATEICHKRFRLFQPMRQFFPEIVFWTNKDCQVSPINPHSCLPRLIEKRGGGRDGLLYMHFDAIVKPEAMAESFDPSAIGVFDGQTYCSVADGCGWCAWHASKQWLEEAYKAIDRILPAARPDHDRFWLGTDDLFYIPQSAFGLYSELAHTMHRVHHEIAGPTMWRLISQAASVPVAELGCAGGCCREVKVNEALERGFRCGHPFHLDHKENRDTFTKAMLMH